MPESPDFNPLAQSYAAARLGYPAELFAWLSSVAPAHELAWDAATGSGQAALGLASHFRRVIATDRSEAQIAHAKPHSRVEYRVAPAEVSGLPPNSVDLVTVAAAIHWFDRPLFYQEVRRVARERAVLAAWTYHVARLLPPFEDLLWPFYRDVVGPHFLPGARLVDASYEAIELPGQALTPPPCLVSARWTAADVLAFVKTWSGVPAYAHATGRDPVTELVPHVERILGSGIAHELRWPVYLRAARL